MMLSFRTVAYVATPIQCLKQNVTIMQIMYYKDTFWTHIIEPSLTKVSFRYIKTFMALFRKRQNVKLMIVHHSNPAQAHYDWWFWFRNW